MQPQSPESFKRLSGVQQILGMHLVVDTLDNEASLNFYPGHNRSRPHLGNRHRYHDLSVTLCLALETANRFQEDTIVHSSFDDLNNQCWHIHIVSSNFTQVQL